jgi:hypothetical protein
MVLRSSSDLRKQVFVMVRDRQVSSIMILLVMAVMVRDTPRDQGVSVRDGLEDDQAQDPQATPPLIS